jgi:hypothetical protein
MLHLLYVIGGSELVAGLEETGNVFRPSTEGNGLTRTIAGGGS